MGKIDELKAGFQRKARESRELIEKLTDSVSATEKAAKKTAKAQYGEGMTLGAVYAVAAALGTIVTDRLLMMGAGKWPWMKTYRKWLDFAIGIVLVMLSKLDKRLAGLAIAGFAWLAIQIFAFMANKMGMAAGFSVEGMSVTNDAGMTVQVEDDEVEQAIFGAVLAGVDDETAFRLADAVETGLIGTAVAVALPAVLKIAEEYGPQAVATIQKIIGQARRGHRRKEAKSKILDARAVRASQLATQSAAGKGSLYTPPPAALPPVAQQGEAMQALRDALKNDFQNIRADFSAALEKERAANQAALEASQAEVNGWRERLERREERRDERRDVRRENMKEDAQAATSSASVPDQVKGAFQTAAIAG